jgi:hypothetical protein
MKIVYNFLGLDYPGKDPKAINEHEGVILRTQDSQGKGEWIRKEERANMKIPYRAGHYLLVELKQLTNIVDCLQSGHKKYCFSESLLPFPAWGTGNASLSLFSQLFFS